MGHNLIYAVYTYGDYLFCVPNILVHMTLSGNKELTVFVLGYCCSHLASHLRSSK